MKKRFIPAVLMLILLVGTCTPAFALSWPGARTTEPGTDNRYYYKDNVMYQIGYGLPNCTAYVHGRIFELTGKAPGLSRNNANTYWGRATDGYPRGQVPKLGAVACWATGSAGHVAIVEKVSGSDVWISESNWGGRTDARFRFRYYKMTAAQQKSLQGYIYCANFGDNNLKSLPLEGIAKVSAHSLSADGKRATIQFQFLHGAKFNNAQIKVYLKAATDASYPAPKTESVKSAFPTAFYPLGKRTDGGTQWTDGNDLLAGREYTYKFVMTTRGTEYSSKEYRFTAKDPGAAPVTPTPATSTPLENIADISHYDLSADGKKATIAFTFKSNAYQDNVQIRVYLKPASAADYAAPKLESVKPAFQKAFYPLGNRTDGGTQWTDGKDLLPGTEYTYKFGATIKGVEYASKEYRFTTKGEAPLTPVPAPTAAPVPTAVPAPTAAPTPAPLYGDANADKSLSIQDVQAIIEYLINGTHCPDMDLANGNRDDKVDLQDLTWLIDRLVP